MSLTNNRTLEIPLKPESYETADQFIKQWLIQKRISNEGSFETMLLFEALFNDMIEQGYGQDTILTIKTQKNFGEYTITLGFEGESYIPSMKKDRKSISPELQIVQAYSDKVGYRYRLGYNRVSIVVKRNSNSSLLYCLIAILLAVPVSLALITFVSADNLTSLDDQFIYPARKGIILQNLIEGGAQERGKRAGTENLPGVAAMAAALKEAAANMEQNNAHLTEIRDYLIKGLSAIPHSALNGDAKLRLPGNINFSFEGIEGEGILLLLDQKGISASSGSACTSGALDPSHVLLSIGRIHDVAHGSLRLSIGEDITKEQADYIIESVREVVAHLRSFSPVWRDLQEGKKEYILK